MTVFSAYDKEKPKKKNPVFGILYEEINH